MLISPFLQSTVEQVSEQRPVAYQPGRKAGFSEGAIRCDYNNKRKSDSKAKNQFQQGVRTVLFRTFGRCKIFGLACEQWLPIALPSPSAWHHFQYLGFPGGFL